jgi:hypothetical protein
VVALLEQQKEWDAPAAGAALPRCMNSGRSIPGIAPTNLTMVRASRSQMRWDCWIQRGTSPDGMEPRLAREWSS